MEEITEVFEEEIKTDTMPLYKLLNFDKNHFGFQFQDGLNIDTVPFREKETVGYGLYFTNKKFLLRWINRTHHWICEVEIPKDAKVAHFESKSKADRIILKNCRPIKEVLDENYTQSELFNVNDALIRFIDNPTENMCKWACKHGYFKSVPNPSKLLCLTYVQMNGKNLQHIIKQDEEICLAAIADNFHAAKFIQTRTSKIDELIVNRLIAEDKSKSDSDTDSD